MLRGVKIAIVGAGSVYTPELLDMMGKMRDQLRVGELCLTDTDPERLAVIHGFCGRMLEAMGLSCTVSSTMDRVEAIHGAEFVVAQIRVGGNAARARDERIAQEYGLLGQETTGACGFAKALRTLPVMVDIARDVERHSPNAWIINYTNPTGIVAEAVNKYTGARIISLCGGGRHPGNMLKKSLGIEHDRVRYDFFGLNHFNFSYNITVDGTPLTDEQYQAMAEAVPGIDPALTKALGCLPGLYIPYYYNRGARLRHAMQAEQTRGEVVQQLERELLALYADPKLCSKPELLNKRGGGDYAEMALGVIAALAYNRDSFFVCNVPNGGVIPYLPDDAVIETACMVNAAGARPISFKSFPEATWGMVCAVKNYESLAVEAAMTGDRNKALLALLAHPLIMDYDLAVPLLNKLLEASRSELPLFFKGVNGEATA